LRRCRYKVVAITFNPSPSRERAWVRELVFGCGSAALGKRLAMVVVLFKLVFWAVALIGLYVAVGALWARYYHADLDVDEVHFATTSDGWKVALHRYLPHRREEGIRPVVLCHGLGANRYNFDLGRGPSLARYLRERGHDVWVLELRGAGLSSRPRWFNGRRYTWNFDDFVERDIPAALDLVRKRTGADHLNWVGHSMGGILMYSYLQGEGREGIASAVAVSSPGIFTLTSRIRPLHRLLRALLIFPAIHLEILARGAAPLLGRSKLLLALGGNNPETMDGRAIRLVMGNLATDISKPLLRQFVDWVESGDIRTADRRRSYRDGYGEVQTPMLFLSGSIDALAPPESVRYVYDRIGSAEKELREFGRSGGDTVDYGHGDIMMGKRAEDKVFPVIEGWLKAH